MGKFAGAIIATVAVSVASAETQRVEITKGGHFNEYIRKETRAHGKPEPALYSQFQKAGLPQSFTWQDVKGKSYVTESRNQHIPQYCGSCWAHGAVSALSDRVKIARDAKGADINLSVQHVLNCGGGVAGSCYGGSHTAAYEWIHDNGYIAYESENPYMACSSDSDEGFCGKADWTCKAENIARTCSTFTKMGGKCVGLNKFPKATVKEYGTVTGAENMKKEIFARGPIACGVDADNVRNYEGGVLNVPDGSRNINHVISIVGWGYDDDLKKQYWIIRNSWGEYWGEMGYFRVVMGDNQMGLEEECAWAVPGDFTTSNFPCGEDGKGCVDELEIFN